MKRDLPTKPLASPQERWYVDLSQRTAHRLAWDTAGHWTGTRCGRTDFWPWFPARPRERRCTECLRLDVAGHAP